VSATFPVTVRVPAAAVDFVAEPDAEPDGDVAEEVGEVVVGVPAATSAAEWDWPPRNAQRPASVAERMKARLR